MSILPRLIGNLQLIAFEVAGSSFCAYTADPNVRFLWKLHHLHDPYLDKMESSEYDDRVSELRIHFQQMKKDASLVMHRPRTPRWLCGHRGRAPISRPHYQLIH